MKKMNKFHNVETLELLNIIENSVGKTTEAMIECCEALAEYKRRGELHPLMYQGFFKWFEPIAAGTINPTIVTVFSGEDHIISKFIGMPMKQQNDVINNDFKVKLVQTNNKDELVEIEKPIEKLNRRQFEQVFDDGKIRSFTQQAKIVKAPPPKLPAPAPPAMADKKGGFLVIYGKYIELQHLIEPLSELDFVIVRKSEYEKLRAKVTVN